MEKKHTKWLIALLVLLPWLGVAQETITTYKVTVKAGIANGTLTANPDKNIKRGEKVTLTATPESATYRLKAGSLKAYKTGAEGTTVAIAPDKTFSMPEYDVTVECEFEQVPAGKTYTVTFDAQGGQPTPPVQMVQEGKLATTPKAPQKKGFSLKFWSLDGKAPFNFFKTPITSNITLKAIWEKDENTSAGSTLLAEAHVQSNPFGELLTLVNAENAQLVEVYNISGQLMVSARGNGQKLQNLNATTWPTGLYIIRLIDSEQQTKLLKAIRE